MGNVLVWVVSFAVLPVVGRSLLVIQDPFFKQFEIPSGDLEAM